MADNSTSTSPATIAISKWFPVTKQNWGLDAVTLLAVIGEASIADNAQAMTASMLCLLPRILPAPQALLKPTRPTRLPTYNAQMVGVYNGVCLDSVGFFANIIHPLEDEAPYSFRVFEIRHSDDVVEEEEDERRRVGDGRNPSRKRAWSNYLLPRGTAEANTMVNVEGKRRGRKAIPKPPPQTLHSKEKGNDRATGGATGVTFVDVEKGSGSRAHHAEPIPGIQRRLTAKEKVTDFVANPSLKPKPRPAVPPALTSPIHIITVLSFIMTLVIFGLTAYWRDGNALLATVIISAQASLVGYASWWKPQLMMRPPHGGNVPAGDMMIRTREGAFILAICSEEVARELYTGTEECEYHVGPRLYRFLMAVGTMLLMVGVVLLGNTKFNAQALISGSYILLNGSYWLLGMIPKRYFWDMSRYEWNDITPEDARNADKTSPPPFSSTSSSSSSSSSSSQDDAECFPSFTRTLWYAIRETHGQTGWVERSGTAPGTAQWRQWLREASDHAKRGDRAWAAVARKNAIMEEAVRGPNTPLGTHDDDVPRTDPAEQRAPLTEVRPGGEMSVVTMGSAF